MSLSQLARRVRLAAPVAALALALALGVAAPSAQAVDPSAAFSPSMLLFPALQPLVGGSADGLLTLTNKSAGPLKILTTDLGGIDIPSFAVVSDTCTGNSLGAGTSCAYTIRFTAMHIGPNGATLSVTTDGALNPTPAQLVGTGLAPPRPDPPVNIVAPSISGTPDQGQVLHCNPGTWSDPTAGFDYFWARGGAGITDAAGQDYTIGYDDVGFDITCRAFANSAGGRVAAISTSVVPVDRIVPVCTLKANAQNMPTVRALGFQVTSTCSEPVTAKYTLSVSKADRKKYKLASTTIGTANETAAAGVTVTRIGITATAKRKLRKAKRLRFTATLVGTDRVFLKSKSSSATATAKPPAPPEDTEEE